MSRRLLFIFLFLLYVGVTPGAPQKNIHPENQDNCRCGPRETCWPSDEDWKAFNETIQGNLLQIRPVGYVCHGESFEKKACDEVRSRANDSIWRGSEPGALQYTNWESWPEHGQYCYVDDNNDNDPRVTSCGQGRIALYSAVVNSAEQIQTAVRFARDRRLRLVIKNTGHDLTGRSSSPGSFQIATYRLKQIDYVKNFVPAGSSSNGTTGNDQGMGPAVTLGAGVLGGELYEAAAAGGYTAIAGLCSTVGVAGGFIQGGGISIMSPTLGMASDNALQFTVVTAESEIVIANQYQNSDLFWALRGGGGGTFGVVVNVTIQVYPAVSAVHFTMNSTVTAINEDFWTVVSQLYAAIPGLSAGRNFVQVDVFPQDHQDAMLSIWAYMIGATDAAAIDAHFISTVGAILDRNGIAYTFSSRFIEQFSAGMVAKPTNVYGGGIGTLHGSVLISESYAASTEGPIQMASAFSQLQLRPGDAIEVASMAGGKVRTNGATVQSAVHPSWREALLFVDLALGLSSASSAEEQAAVRGRLTKSQMPLLYGLENHRMASYYNIPNPGEPNFRRAYWGAENYKRLYAIKQAWDPEGLFIVRLGVGSEDWDENGMCRRSTYP